MPDALARQRTLATLLLLVAAASWGGNWVAARAITLEVPPFALSFWRWAIASALLLCFAGAQLREDADRKSTRLNSSHGYISYAVFCLKKNKKTLPDSTSNSRSNRTSNSTKSK